MPSARLKKANNHTVQVWQPYKLYRTNKLNQMLFFPGRGEKNYGESESPRCFFLGVKKTSRENHLDIFWQAQKQLESITQMHFSGGEKSI